MKSVLFVLGLLLVISSCSSDDNGVPQQDTPEENFFGLEIGKTWFYKYYKRIYNTDEFEDLGAESEVTVLNTTTMNGEEYFTLETQTTYGDRPCGVCPDEGITTTHVRDSLGYLINAEGVILYSRLEVDEEYLISEQTQYNIFGKLLTGEESVTTEYDTLNCLVNEVYAKSNTDGTIPPGRDYLFYSENIGEVLRMYSGVMSEQHNWEKRLVAIAIP